MGYVINAIDFPDGGDNRFIVYEMLFPNGKRYIGCTSVSFRDRISSHIHEMNIGTNYKVYKAMRKYGVNNIKFKVISVCSSKEEMFQTEKAFIIYFDSQVNGYNSTSGGEGAPGKNITEENRENISAGQKLRFSKPEEREKTSIAVKKWIAENPDRAKEAAEKKLKIITSDAYRNMMSKKMKDVYKNKPELIKKWRVTMDRKYQEDPDIKHRISKTLGGTPIQVFKNDIHVATFPTTAELSLALKVSAGNVRSMLKGNRNHVGGYTFKKLEWSDDITFFNNVTC